MRPDGQAVVLLVSNERDITTDYIVLELQKRGTPYWRLNTERIADLLVSFDPKDNEWVLEDAEQERCLTRSQIRSAYYRRPGLPLPDLTGSIGSYRRHEWNSWLWSFYKALEGFWLSSPDVIEAAENKPRQQRLAVELGFQVPDTLITNSLSRAQVFAAGREIIGKPLRSALLNPDRDEGAIIYTSKMPSLVEDDREGFAATPLILQQEIKKRSDVRVTVVGERVFATSIDSQMRPETRVDWRKGQFDDLPHRAISLDTELTTRCIAITKALGLRFGAIDLIEDEAGAFWFLEINPNGQWAWIERRTGQPISSAIVDELCRS